MNPTSSVNQMTPKKLKNQINLAMIKMKDNIIRTPCERRTYLLDEDNGINLFLKKECRQITGSFEARGALYILLKLSNAQKKNGVISASTADFALSLCHFGDKLKIPVTVVLPKTTQLKIQYRWTIATMIFEGNNLYEAKGFASMLAREKNMYLLKRSSIDMITGYGTLAMEIMEEVSYLDAVLVPYDKMELIKSFKMVMKNSNIKIITVQPRNIESDEDVISRGEITVKKSLIADAMLLLFEQEKCIVDIGGATCLGAVLKDSVQRNLKKKRVVVILPSCHINMVNLFQYIKHALISEYRFMKFTLRIPKQPPSIAELYNMLTQLNVKIKNIQITQKQTSMSKIDVKVVCEIKNEKHAKIIVDFVTLKYKDCNLKISKKLNCDLRLTK